MSLHPRPLTKRFWDKVRKTETCWLWTARLHHNGYGRISKDGEMQQAHRVAYELLVGPIPEGLDLDHLCRNRACVNPAHLEPVTRRENLLRGVGLAAIHAQRTHCPKGHPYDAANTLVEKNGARKCKTCKYAIVRRWRERQNVSQAPTA